MRELLEAGRELGRLQAENDELRQRVRELEREEDLDRATAHLKRRDEWLELSKAAATTLGGYLSGEAAQLRAELERVTHELEAARQAAKLAQSAEMLSSNAREFALEDLREQHAAELEALRAEHKRDAEAVADLIAAERAELERVKAAGVELATRVDRMKRELEKADTEASRARDRADTLERERDHERSTRLAVERVHASTAELENDKAGRLFQLEAMLSELCEDKAHPPRSRKAFGGLLEVVQASRVKRDDSLDCFGQQAADDIGTGPRSRG